MKFLRILPIAAIACLAVSCENGSGSLSENASQTDSLMYYLGQMHAADYLREANRDTTLKENSEKQAYLSGVRAGLAALKEGNESYNKGVMMGMQMASQMMSFTEQMGVDINKNAYVGSLQSALMADTMPNTTQAQRDFRNVMQNIEAAKEARDKAASQESLNKVAATSDLPKISDDLYGKVTEANNDTIKLADGDEINLVANVTKEDGESVNIPMSPKGKIGNKRSFPELISTAVLTLKSGETGEFLTTAHALLGSRASQMNLEPTDVLKLTLTPTLVPKEEEPAK
ncbi:MAG: hypothetical protein J1E16_02505 [Muribaculaceae bacterium]|nr:hypothetical protein [Muribaculaceae bacterium]